MYWKCSGYCELEVWDGGTQYLARTFKLSCLCSSPCLRLTNCVCVCVCHSRHTLTDENSLANTPLRVALPHCSTYSLTAVSSHCEIGSDTETNLEN